MQILSPCIDGYAELTASKLADIVIVSTLRHEEALLCKAMRGRSPLMRGMRPTILSIMRLVS